MQKGQWENNCPVCGRKIKYDESKYFPFCSYRCKMADLGKWLEEEYKIQASIDGDVPENPER